jgi:glycosyltransferase involved in cell wall biosynthesis
MSKKVIHILPHMGPGVGKAVSSVSILSKELNSNYQHEILLLEVPNDRNFIDKCLNANINVHILKDISLAQILNAVDIVQIEWWHHPRVFTFLYELAKYDIRLVAWSHISGCNYPNLPANLVKSVNNFIFTTGYSYENKFWTEEERNFIKENTEVIFGAGEFTSLSDIKLKKQNENSFNIGYIGTLDYRKLNPNFIDYCASLDIPNVKFTLVGNPDKKEILLHEAKGKGIQDKFIFTGFVDNIKKQMEQFDLFIYLLNPEHFGTTDNALLEAMAAGLPIVILNQCGEKYLIKHMESGIIVNDVQDFKKWVQYLYQNEEVRIKIGKKAREVAVKEYSTMNSVLKLEKKYDEVMTQKKRKHDLLSVFGEKPHEWFLSGLGDEREDFLKSMLVIDGVDVENKYEIEDSIKNSREILKGETKSSIRHFVSYYPEDGYLSKWGELI